MKQVQITEKTELAIQKEQTARDQQTVISNPAKFYVVVDPSVVVQSKQSGQASLQDFIDNELGTIISLVLNDYLHIQTSKSQLAGTASVTAGEKDVVGTGTAFLTDFAAGEIISLASQEIEIESVTDDENLVLKVHHQFGATNSLVYKTTNQWWQYTSGDGTQPAHYTSIPFDPENQLGISADGLYYPDPTNILTDYSANFVIDPGTGVAFYADITSDNYFQSQVDPLSMHINIIKTAGNWPLGVQAHIILVVDEDNDLFSIIHSNGSDFTAPAEWSLTPEYTFRWASVIEGMIVDSVKRTTAANNAVAQIEDSYQTVRSISRKMGGRADIVVGTPAQNGLLEADKLIDDWSDGLKANLTGTVTVAADNPNVVGTGTAFLTELADNDFIVVAGKIHKVASRTDDENLILAINHVAGATDVTAIKAASSTRTRVLFREATYIPASDWEEPENLHFEFDRDAIIDMTAHSIAFASLTGRVVLTNAPDNSLIIVGDCHGLIIESDNFLCLDITGAIGVVIHNGRTIHGQAAAVDAESVRKKELDIGVVAAMSYSDTELGNAINPVDVSTGFLTQINFDGGMMFTKVTTP